MKIASIVLIGWLVLFPNLLIAQSLLHCTHCKMDISQEKFRATAVDNSGEKINFDAIECLINFSKKTEIKQLKVTNYNTSILINAKDAFYLKSENLPSPMGANLSAYDTREEALKTQKEKEGKIMNWSQLLMQFNDSKFGATDSHHHHKADAFAPSGVMGDHLHPKGGLMLAVQYMNMAMDGNRKGNKEISDQNLYQDFRVAPQDMTMEMYMIGIMYAPSKKLTLMLMQSYRTKKMNLTARMMMPGGMIVFRDFSTTSSGLGDTKLSALYGIWSGEENSFHLNTQISFPSGTIENRDDTPMTANAKLPYAMQLGSGTFDLTFGGTIKGRAKDFSWGIQQLNTFRTGKNDQGYRFGNLYELNLWGSYSITNNFSASLRLKGSTEGTITGNDSELNLMMVHTANPDNYGGELLRSFVGLNYLLPKQKLLFTVSAGTPLYQNYNGIFMNETFSFNAGVKYTLL
jgi:hypothetical protein